MKSPARLHLYLTILWVCLAVPTLLWWRESVLWVALMSLYANVAGHWSAFQSAHTEESLTQRMDGMSEKSEG